MGSYVQQVKFIDRGYKPSSHDFVVEFLLEPAEGASFETAAEAVAAESSIGTWTDISTLTDAIKKRLKPSIFHLSQKSGAIKIAYPGELFEDGNIPQLMSAVAGNIFGMREIASLRLEDIDFPDYYMKKFKGPAFGIEGIRKLFKVRERPLLGTIIKPKVGLNEKEHAKVAYNAWLGGCDIVKDDENLSSMNFNNFDVRVKETLKMRGKCEEETGEKKCYLPNVTAPYNEMVRRAKFAKHAGCEYAMVDIVTVGWSALQELRDENPGLILHGHRAGHAAFTRNPKHGISMLAVAKLCRLIGLDQLHVGAIVGKMEGSAREVKEIGEEIEQKIVQPHTRDHVLAENWLHLKPMFAVCSGGLHPGKVPSLLKAMGPHIIIQMGGGIHGHPQGTIFGAKAARQAIDASLQGIPLQQYARMHKELAAALRKWVD